MSRLNHWVAKITTAARDKEQARARAIAEFVRSGPPVKLPEPDPVLLAFTTVAIARHDSLNHCYPRHPGDRPTARKAAAIVRRWRWDPFAPELF